MLRLQGKSGSLTRLLPEAQLRVAISEQAQLQAWSFGWCRWAQQLEALVDQLLDKPLKAKDKDVYLLMQLGVFQLMHTPTANYAAVDETVKVVKRLKKPWARGLVNAVLRNFQRQLESLQAALAEEGLHSHPAWLITHFRHDWPDQWEAICTANNQQAPMCLRINQRHGSVKDYQARLHDEGLSAGNLAELPWALVLDAPVPVGRLPGFDQGDVSVQDGAAQLAGQLLAKHVPAGGRLLDACAAPGGKTAHAAESGWYSDITAIDHDDTRLSSVLSTLQRLQLESMVTLIHADASATATWWDGCLFDAILLDAPCSGTGVIRRHPDIKLLRRDTDIAALAQLQARLLDALWQTLKPNGVLLYVTCSILKTENEHQLASFLQRTRDAQALEGIRQIFPGEQAMDGFFYAPIRKCAS